MYIRYRVVPLTVVYLCIHLLAMGQWAQQTVPLQPGWNAVYFWVEPQPRDCAEVFRGIPVESIWGWNRRFSSTEFVDDPNTLLPQSPKWLAYFPPTSPQADMTNMHIVQGGRSYLIKLSGAKAVNLVIKGRPKIPPIVWVPDTYNLVGFNISGTAPPTFTAFFASSPAHAGQRVFRMSTTGRWLEITAPATTRMRSGEAYWIYCKGTSDYQGPLSVAFDAGDGLDYERIVTELAMRIENASTVNRTITLIQKNSNQPPSTSYPALAGTVPLSYFQRDYAHNQFGWKPLPSPLTLTIPAGGEQEILLMVRRPNMAPFTPPTGRDALYQSLLDINDGAGSLLTVPVSARGLKAPRLAGGSAPFMLRGSSASPGKFDAPPEHIRTGLWVGNATITEVCNPTSGSLDMTRPLPVASPFSYPLIIHVDSAGQGRLLRQVLQMWKDGAWIPNPDDPTSQTYILDPNNPGRTVLLTDDSLIPQYSGMALRDVKLVGRRISSPAFGFDTPILMTGGDFGTAGAPAAGCTIVLDYRDALNPFQHKYHPDHNNLDERFEQTLPEGFESYTVTRVLSLTFTATDPEDLISTGWGDELIGGIYRETVAGIHRSPIYAKGTFRLQRVSGVGILNDGQR